MDVLITYTDETPMEAILAAVQREQAGGASVRVQRAGETAVRSRRTLAL